MQHKTQQSLKVERYEQKEIYPTFSRNFVAKIQIRNYNKSMSKLSFKAFCIENYAEYKSIPSSTVFKMFQESRLLTHLSEDYEDLHGMGKEYLMDYFDRWFGKEEKE